MLDRHRSSNGFGIDPISWSDIKAFFDLHEIIPEEYELLAISMLDNAKLSYVSKELEKKQNKK